jgi:hypothetical protein
MTFRWPFPNSPEIVSPVSWIADGITLRHSRIQGIGLFANRNIVPGEIVMILGGTIFSANEVRQGKATDQSTTGYREGFYIGRPTISGNQRPLMDEYLNHSCDPNLWLEGRLNILARRRIFVGEEITVDYSTWEISEDWQLPQRCNCGVPTCRRTVTGSDWRSRDFQRQYEGHLLPCLSERILNGSLRTNSVKIRTNRLCGNQIRLRLAARRAD